MIVGAATSTLVVLSFVLLFVFVARFARTTWRRTAMGRQQMLMNGAFMSIMGLAVFTIAVGRGWAGWPYVRLACWIVIPWVFWRQHVLFTRAQREAASYPPAIGEESNMKSVSSWGFSREPAAWLAALGAVLAVVVAFRLPGVSADQAPAIIAAVTAVTGLATAWRTRPIAPSLVTYFGTSAFQLLAAYGLDVTSNAISAVNVALVALLVLVRGAITPRADPAPTAPEVGPVR